MILLLVCHGCGWFDKIQRIYWGFSRLWAHLEGPQPLWVDNSLLQQRARVMPVPSGRYGPNVVAIDRLQMLLATTSGGVAAHLTAAAHEPGTGREAVWDFHFDRDEPADTVTRYDREALTDPCWAQTTLCGRQWAVMVGGDGGAVGRLGEVTFAPTCCRCLARIDRHFSEPSPNSWCLPALTTRQHLRPEAQAGAPA